MKKRTGPSHDAEMRTLRARLADAEENLRAIRSGDVDALLVTGERGDQVFTLAGADRAYRQLVETMSEGAATLSQEGVCLYCNERLAEMLGRPLDEVIGSTLQSWLPPADRETLAEILRRARTEVARREITLLTSKGAAVPVYLSASRLHDDAAGTVVCLVLTDLTAQRRHEHVAAAEQLARSILEQAAEAIVVCDVEGRVMRASEVARQFCDDGLLQGPFAEAFLLQTLDARPFELVSVLKGETLRDVDVVLCQRGRELAFLLNARPLVRDQQTVGCVVTWTDITARKQVEDDLREKEFLLSEAQRLGSVGSWYWDLHGPMAWSEETYRVYGVEPDDFVPTVETLLGLIHPDDRSTMQAWIAACIAGEQPAELAFRINPPDSTTRHLLGRGEVARDAAGQPAYVAGTVQDITERLKSEGTLRLQSAALNAAASAMVITDRNGKVYLPVVDGAADAGAAAGAVALARGTETVLVVEDDAAVRRVATRVLGAAGYTVLTAANGLQALALLETHPEPVQLVLADMVMPGMGGRELAARLGASRPNQKILFTSGYTDDTLRSGGLPNVDDQFIGKPYSATELVRKVREVLDLELAGPSR